MTNKKVVREDYKGRKERISYDMLIEELIFQIKEDFVSSEMYEEYLMEDVEKPLNFDEYCQEVLEMKLQQINNGYCLYILGDIYYLE